MYKAFLKQKSSGKKELQKLKISGTSTLTSMKFLMPKVQSKAELNKKAAIGAAMTWVVATFIILFVVILFIYASNIMAKEKDLKSLDISILKGEGVVGMSSEQVLLSLLKTKIGIRSVSNYIFQDEYLDVQGSVENILSGLMELKGKAVVYIGDKKVELDGNELEVKNV